MKQTVIKINSSTSEHLIIVNIEDLFNVTCAIHEFYSRVNSKAARGDNPKINNNDLLFDMYGNSTFKGFNNGKEDFFKASVCSSQIYDEDKGTLI